VSYTIKNLRDVEDMAVKHGFSETQEARFPRGDLGAEATGVAYHVLKPGKRQPFAHRHQEAEEIFVVLSGSGRVKLDHDIVEIRPLDSIRLSPGSRAPSRPTTTASRSSSSARTTTRTRRWSRTSGRTEAGAARGRARAYAAAATGSASTGGNSPSSANPGGAIRR